MHLATILPPPPASPAPQPRPTPFPPISSLGAGTEGIDQAHIPTTFPPSRKKSETGVA